jgi:hypothetical protein
MAIDFRVQGVDFSGIGQAISRGIDNMAAIKRQEQELFRKDIENFEKNYNNDNLKESDIPDFNSAFQEYKEKALKYSRANKGIFGNDESISYLHKDMEDAKVKMNNIYSNSAKAKQYIDSVSKYSQQLISKGYRVPKEISGRYDYFMNTPSSMIKDEDYINPYEVKIKPSVENYSKAQRAINLIPFGTPPDDVEDIKETIPGIGDVSIKKINKYKAKDPMTVFYTAQTALDLDEGIFNEYKEAADNLNYGLSLTPEQIAEKPELATVKANADNMYAQIEQKIAGRLDLSQIQPDDLKYVMYGVKSGGFDKIPNGAPVYDDTEFKRALKLKGIKTTDAKFKQAIDQFNKRLGISQEGLKLRGETLDLNKKKFEAKSTGTSAILKLLKDKKTQ